MAPSNPMQHSSESENPEENQNLRDRLVLIALTWETTFGVAPSITCAVSEYDAARLVGHTDETYGLACSGQTAVSRGFDFTFSGNRFQIKACRPSGKPGSRVTKVPQARNYEWDYLIWILYNEKFQIVEAWQWPVDDYRAAFEGRSRLSPSDMRGGTNLLAPPEEN
jgi:hypothetical protein